MASFAQDKTRIGPDDDWPMSNKGTTPLLDCARMLFGRQFRQFIQRHGATANEEGRCCPVRDRLVCVRCKLAAGLKAHLRQHKINRYRVQRRFSDEGVEGGSLPLTFDPDAGQTPCQKRFGV
jgi:hypothetical protein